MFVDGSWRITVSGKDADFDQRAVVVTPYGTLVLPGRVGESLVVDADTWELRLEHRRPGGGWQPDAQVVSGPVITIGGRRSREVRARDCHWPGIPGDDLPCNLVLRLDGLDALDAFGAFGAFEAEGSAARRETAEAIAPASAPLVRTSSDRGSGVRRAVERREAPTGRTAPEEAPAPTGRRASTGW
ncbi:hypothetical protein ACGF12_15065 [Kitasatospora sp. NPDC048296]|uniref:hypothetical protein n=1 Tax=Kitasatospora sp. NPDC048296 TaxID=3364048 RepID=UPI003721220C